MRDFEQIRCMIRAVYKGAIEEKDTIAAWYSSLKKYSYEDAKNAVMAYVETSHYEPKPSDIIGFIPKGQNRVQFDPTPKMYQENGKWHRMYICPRCQDSGMLTWEDENQCTVGVPCDCPAGHYYYRWGWLTQEEQEAWIKDPKNGHHGEVVGENWYKMQPKN